MVHVLYFSVIIDQTPSFGRLKSFPKKKLKNSPHERRKHRADYAEPIEAGRIGAT